MLKYYTLFLFIPILFLKQNLYGENKNLDLKLSKETIKIFYKYISSNRQKQDRFLITVDGTGTYVWACPQTLCFPSGKSYYVKPCSDLNNNIQCEIFAIGRKIVLKNKVSASNDLRILKQSDNFRKVSDVLKKLDF